MARQKLGFWYRFAVGVLKPPVILLTRRRWLNQELLPATGGIVVAPNHISHFDPLAVGAVPLRQRSRAAVPREGRALRRPGRRPDRARDAGQIPVHRETGAAADAMRDAVAAVDAGECVVSIPRAR